MLAVTPADRLMAMYDAARSATHQVTGAHAPEGQPARWRPHITICYSTSSQPAKPIIDSLGTRLPGCDINISALSLVIQHGAGLAIGLTLTPIHLISIPISNTSVNPARSTGVAFLKLTAHPRSSGCSGWHR